MSKQIRLMRTRALLWALCMGALLPFFLLAVGISWCYQTARYGYIRSVTNE